jgi:urocanate hydratase
MMYGQMTAGSWIYIGTQGILQGTFETFAAARKRHSGADPRSRACALLTAGSAAWAARSRSPSVMPAASCSRRDRPERASKAPGDPLLDERIDDLDEALARVRKRERRRGAPKLASALCGNAPTCIPELVRRGETPTSSPSRRRRTTRSSATCRRA